MEQGRQVARTQFEKLIVDLDETMEAYNNVQDAIVRELSMIGIKPKQRPKMPEPELTRPISEMTNEELGDFQGECAVWETFLGTQQGIYKSKAMALKQRAARLLSRLKNELREDGVAAANRADIAKDDDRYGKADVEYITAKGIAEGIEFRNKGLETQRKACSRYVEIRTSEMDIHTRTENVRNRRRGSPPTFRK